ncbi:nephrin isoform X2 [Bemisia tabaci]|uniref:nephrin isoform X2 n=1 Tax=Bemisia tabaci TaxID=7038 RepID=UPI0008F9C3CC|nr:PREDICTED: nephrin-like isoform X2 [Bemisia tabaci]
MPVWIILFVLVFFSAANCHAALLNITEDSGPISSVEAVLDGIAKLPCNMSIYDNAVEDRIDLIMWFKHNQTTPFYSIDFREKRRGEGQHWNRESLNGRASFKLNGQDAKLILEGIQQSDGGLYRCRVDFSRAPTRFSRVNLTVIEPPEQLRVVDVNGEHIKDYVIGPFREGAMVEIACNATGGHPRPNVTWWKGNARLNSNETVAERSVRNTLRFGPLQRSDLGTLLTCQAINNQLSPPIQSHVRLDMTLPPLMVRLKNEQHPLSADTSYEIVCEVIGARPKPNVTWWLDAKQLHTAKEPVLVDDNSTISTLKFIPKLGDTGKTLACRAGSLEHLWTLNIYHVPVVSLGLHRSLSSVDLREGIDVYLECNITANPNVYRVTWRHNDKPLFHNASAGVIIGNQTLVLQNITRHRAGLYTCVASNSEGDGVSNPLNLDVKFAPVCKAGQPTQYGSGRKEAARVICEVEANPAAVTFSWRLNNSTPLAPAPLTAADNQLRSVVAMAHQYGVLFCSAENEIGPQRQPCVFHVIPTDKPEPPTNCTVQNRTNDLLNVECSPGWDGGLPQFFVMEVVTHGTPERQLMVNMTSSSPVFSTSSLLPSFSYDVVLYAANSKGHSEPRVLRIEASKAQSTQRRTALLAGELELGPIIGILVGSLVTLIFLVCITTVLVRRRHMKKHSKMTDSSTKEDLNDSADSLDKNPDIIPHEDCLDEDEKAFEMYRKRRSYPSHIGSNNCDTISKNDKMHAELSLTSPLYSTLLAQQHMLRPPVEPNPPCPADTTATTPLIEAHQRESMVRKVEFCDEVHCQTLKPYPKQTVTATRF